MEPIHIAKDASGYAHRLGLTRTVKTYCGKRLRAHDPPSDRARTCPECARRAGWTGTPPERPRRPA
ncbi:hypothetical protein [Sciscionella marina]|uniref:hypothetical protein n=1 Tax=Sciscionella marina TaxID=508770 RepID=UPI00036796C3|nr:hypothetical protein [Sciscionella marina]